MFERWIRQPDSWEIADNGIIVRAAGCKDYFVDPATGKITANGPLFVKRAQGDFTLSCKVVPQFPSIQILRVEPFSTPYRLQNNTTL